jgi:hypothetical protein
VGYRAVLGKERNKRSENDVSEVRAVRSELRGDMSVRRAVVVVGSITVALLLALILASASALASS